MYTLLGNGLILLDLALKMCQTGLEQHWAWSLLFPITEARFCWVFYLLSQWIMRFSSMGGGKALLWCLALLLPSLSLVLSWPQLQELISNSRILVRDHLWVSRTFVSSQALVLKALPTLKSRPLSLFSLTQLVCQALPRLPLPVLQPGDPSHSWTRAILGLTMDGGASRSKEHTVESGQG